MATVQRWDDVSLPREMFVNGEVTMQFCINTKVIRKILETTAEVWEEIVLQVSETGLYVRAMDNSQVAMADLHIRTEMLKDFICIETTDLPLDLKGLVKVISFIAPTDSKDLWFQHTRESNVLHIRRQGPTPAWFNINLLAERYNVAPKVNKVDMEDYAWQVWIDSLHCHKILEYLKDYGMNVAMIVDDEQISFKVNSTDVGATVRVKAPVKKPNGCKIDNAREAPDTKFSIEYLRRFTKAHAFSKTCELRFHETKPFLLKFPLDDAPDNTDSYFSCMIGGKVEEGE